MEALLLWQFYFLGMKTCKIRHLAIERSQIDKCVDLVSEQYWFLLVHTLLVSANLHKQILGRNMARIIYIVSLFFMISRSRRTTTLCRTRHLYTYRMRTDCLTVNLSTSARNGVSASLFCIKSIGVGDTCRTACMAVNHLIARLIGRIRTCYHLKTRRNVGSPEVVHTLGINTIRQTEVLAGRYMRRGRNRNALCVST